MPSMATEAAKIAIERRPQEIDFIVYALTAPSLFPGPGFVLQRNLGMQNVGVLDIRDSMCSRICICALKWRSGLIPCSGMYKNILVIGEIHLPS